MIRKAAEDDASRIADIQIFGWRNAYRGIVNDEFLFRKLNIAKKTEAIQKTLNENREEWFVFEEDNIIKGMMIFGNARDQDKLESFELWCLYVDPLMMRNGIGSKMISYCENEAKKRKKNEMVVWVFERNKIGISFYEKNGYLLDGKSQIIDVFNEKEVRMIKSIL